MKTIATTEPADGSYPKTFHKAVQGRGGVSATLEHRYERRKVREVLRHLDDLLDDEILSPAARSAETL